MQTAANLTLNETARIGAADVTRTSLLGYRVAMPGGGAIVLDLAEVDALLTATAIGAPVTPPALLSVRSMFPGFLCERWAKGPAAAARASQLRRHGVACTTRTVTDTRRLWAAAGADRVSTEVTEIEYAASSRVPHPGSTRPTAIRPVW